MSQHSDILELKRRIEARKQELLKLMGVESEETVLAYLQSAEHHLSSATARMTMAARVHRKKEKTQ